MESSDCTPKKEYAVRLGIRLNKEASADERAKHVEYFKNRLKEILSPSKENPSASLTRMIALSTYGVDSLTGPVSSITMKCNGVVYLSNTIATGIINTVMYNIRIVSNILLVEKHAEEIEDVVDFIINVKDYDPTPENNFLMHHVDSKPESVYLKERNIGNSVTLRKPRGDKQ